MTRSTLRSHKVQCAGRARERRIRLIHGRLAAAVLLMLSSCNNDLWQSANTGHEDCLDLPVYPPAGITDTKQTVYACVERHAAMYAKGPDSPQAISEAVVVKCEEPIIRYVEEATKEAGEEPQYKVALGAWRKHALPVIAEARARKCYS